MRLLSVTIISLFSIGLLAAAEYEFPANYKTPTGDIQKIVVDCPLGLIKFEQAIGDNIDITVIRVIHMESQAKAEKIAQEIQVDFRNEGRNLKAIVDIPNRHSRAHDIISNLLSGEFNDEIQILIKVNTPPNLMLNVITASADINGNDLHNDLTVKGASSDTRWENVIGNCDIKVASGDFSGAFIEGDISVYGASSDINVDELKGNLIIVTSSGDVTARKIGGNVRIESTSGDIRIYDVKGELDLATTSGDIYAQNGEGSVNANSTSGEIKLNGLTNPKGSFSINTVSGDVYLEMTKNFDGRLEIETHSGEINTDIDMDFRTMSDSYLEGKTGNGIGKININTTSGDISLNEM